MNLSTYLKATFAVAIITGTAFGADAQTFEKDSLIYTVLSAEAKTVAVKTGNINKMHVVIPETIENEGVTYTVTETQERGFEKMKSLLTVDIPKTIVKFGKHSFNECSNLQKTIIHDVNAWAKIDFSNTSLANPAYKSENLYLGDKLLEDVVITDPITQINPLTFYYVKTIKKVTLPPTITKIGKWGFYKCGVQDINLPDALTTSEDYAFQYSGLTHLEMPDNYITMKNGTFLECVNLKSVKLPKNLKTLPLNTFQKCNGLETVEFNEGLETIKKGAFVATSIKTLNLPKSLKKIENQAFLDDIKIEEINIGPNVEMIGYLAFYIQDATREQFNWKSPMRKITCEAVVPPTLQITTDKNGQEYNMAWNDEVYTQATLFVPKESIQAYKEAREWKRFTKIEPIETGVNSIESENVTIAAVGGKINISGTENPYVEVYNISGAKIYAGNTNTVEPGMKGIYIVRCGSKTAKVIL